MGTYRATKEITEIAATLHWQHMKASTYHSSRESAMTPARQEDHQLRAKAISMMIWMELE